MSFPAPETRFAFHVSYGETDMMGVAYYGEYFHYFERARSQFIRERGMSYREVEARGILLPVVEANCRYLRPLRFDDLAVVRCGISAWSRVSLTFVYEVAVDGELKATGSTQHACVDPGGKPVRVPGWLRDLFSGQAVAE